MKFLLLSIGILCAASAEAFTLGEAYDNSAYQDKSLQAPLKANGSHVYSQNVNNQKYQITTNAQNIITRIDYSGNQPIDLKSSLGKYYADYHDAWLKRNNKGNRRFSSVTTNNVTVNTFGFGGNFYSVTLELNKE